MFRSINTLICLHLLLPDKCSCEKCVYPSDISDQLNYVYFTQFAVQAKTTLEAKKQETHSSTWVG